MAIDVKTYAQLAVRVYDKKELVNKMTLPADFEEVHWRDDDALGFFCRCVPFGRRQAGGGFVYRHQCPHRFRLPV
mgnify:CR=1 FL=1